MMRLTFPLRHGFLLIRSIMQSSVRPASPPQAPLQSSDKRIRSTSPEVALQTAETRSTAPKRRKKRKHTPPESGSSEDVIAREVVGLLGSELVAQAEADGLDWVSPFGFREEVELTVSGFSSSGTSCPEVYADTCCLSRIFCSHLHHILVPVWFLTMNYTNRRRTCPCPIVEASMDRRCSIRFAWRGHSRPRIQARKDVLVRRFNQH